MNISDRSRILAINIETPQADKAAGDRRFIAMLEMLARKFQVDLWISDPGADRQYAADRAYFAAIGVNLLGYDIHLNNSFSVVVARRDYDLVIIEFYAAFLAHAAEFRRSQPWAKVIIDTVDVQFLREGLAVAVGVGSETAVEAKKQEEVAAYRAADGLILITDLDAQVLEAEGEMPEANAIIPIILPLRERPKIEREQDVLFVGGFKHAPNEDGITWFVGSVWPAVRQAVPHAHLTVVGSHPTGTVKALDSRENGVEVVGFVPDTDVYLDRAMVSVAPLRFGAGMKGKVCEAMASGLAVVTTSCGAQGLACKPSEEIYVEDSCMGFADAVIALLRDPERAEQVGRSGRTFIAGVCGPEKIEADLLAYAASLLPAQRHSTPALKLRYKYVKAWVLACLRWQRYRLRTRGKGRP